MLMLDIDGLKRVNDMYGHAAGDEVLKSVAAILRSLVTPQDFVFRSGSDEFALILHNADLKAGMHIRDEIRERIKSTNLHITVSNGVCEYQMGEGTHTFVRRVEEALRNDKGDDHSNPATA
jgi:diguanylate cyclase (GGDEF)-like protein